jgi:lysophospholipase L1-like esterase
MLEDTFYDLNQSLPPEKYNRFFYHLGIAGNTAESTISGITTTLLQRARVTQEAGQPLDPGRTLSIISLGLNDSWVRRKTNQPNTDRVAFWRNVGMVASEITRFSRLLYVGPTRCDTNLVSDYRRHAVPSQTESLIQYEDMAAQRVKQAGGAVVYLAKRSSEDPSYTMCNDGIHPNDEGHAWIAQHVRPTFTRMLSSYWTPEYEAAA